MAETLEKIEKELMVRIVNAGKAKDENGVLSVIGMEGVPEKVQLEAVHIAVEKGWRGMVLTAVGREGVPEAVLISAFEAFAEDDDDSNTLVGVALGQYGIKSLPVKERAVQCLRDAGKVRDLLKIIKSDEASDSVKALAKNALPLSTKAALAKGRMDDVVAVFENEDIVDREEVSRMLGRNGWTVVEEKGVTDLSNHELVRLSDSLCRGKEIFWGKEEGVLSTHLAEVREAVDKEFMRRIEKAGSEKNVSSVVFVIEKKSIAENVKKRAIEILGEMGQVDVLLNVENDEELPGSIRTAARNTLAKAVESAGVDNLEEYSVQQLARISAALQSVKNPLAKDGVVSPGTVSKPKSNSQKPGRNKGKATTS